MLVKRKYRQKSKSDKSEILEVLALWLIFINKLKGNDNTKKRLLYRKKTCRKDLNKTSLLIFDFFAKLDTTFHYH